MRMLLLLLLSLYMVSSVHAATLIVDNNGICDDAIGAPYCNVESAVNAAAIGDAVEIGSGTYGIYALTTLKSGMTLRGANTDTTVLLIADLARLYLYKVDNVEISNLTIITKPTVYKVSSITIDYSESIKIIDVSMKLANLPSHGIRVQNSNVNILRSSIDGGQGILVFSASDIPGILKITNSSVTNSRTNGITISNNGIAPREKAEFNNVTISGSSQYGVYIGGSDATLRNSTITNSGKFGLVAVTKSREKPLVTISNSIVAGNNLRNYDCGGDTDSIISLGHNLIGAFCSDSFVEETTDQYGKLSSPLNPELAPLADNGGTTLTHALLSRSPAIDAGSPIPGFGESCDDVDQRGLVRPIDGNFDGSNVCDIGAYESGSTTPLQCI